MSEKFRDAISKVQSLYQVSSIDRTIGCLPSPVKKKFNSILGFINHICQHPNYGKVFTVPDHGFFRVDKGGL